MVWGQDDPYVPFTLANTQKQAFPDAQVKLIQGAGHWPFVDYPDEVRDMIVPFLRRVVGS